MNSEASIAAVFAASHLLLDEENKKRRIRKVWVRDWIQKRSTDGCYNKLLKELRSGQPKLFRNFVRMSANDFDFLLDLVRPLIEKKNTRMRQSIPAGERLALALRYLATGDSYMSLQYLFRIPQSTISGIIPEVCDAIYSVLKDEYMKVIFFLVYAFICLRLIHKKYIIRQNKRLP